MKRNKKILIIGLVLILMLGIVACAGDKKPETGDGDLIPVKYVLPRSLEVLDDAHVWAAVENGYFEEEGLEISVEQSTTGTTDVKMVSFGQAEFCVPAPNNLMVAREAGMPLISVMQVDTRNIFGMCVKSDSDIKEPADMKGKDIVLAFSAWEALFDIYPLTLGLDPDTDINYVVGGENRAQMVELGQADAVFTWEKEYQLWQAQGLDLRYISFEELVPGCANSIVTTMQYAEENPEIVEKFCRAYAKGILFCKENPRAAADIVVNKFPALNLEVDDAVPSIEGLVYITNDKDTEEHGYGWHNADEWEIMKTGAQMTGQFEEDIPVADYFTNDFVEAINEFDYDEVAKDAADYKFK